MSPADLYLAVSERLLKLRTERLVSEEEETEWASVLDVLWHDLLNEGDQRLVEQGLAAKRELVERGIARQKELERR